MANYDTYHTTGLQQSPFCFAYLCLLSFICFRRVVGTTVGNPIPGLAESFQPQYNRHLFLGLWLVWLVRRPLEVRCAQT